MVMKTLVYRRFEPPISGELIIQGPILARSYIDVTEKARTAWFEDVNWYHDENNPTRAYRTGDFVRRNVQAMKTPKGDFLVQTNTLRFGICSFH